MQVVGDRRTRIPAPCQDGPPLDHNHYTANFGSNLMSAIFVSASLTAAGTPQALASTTSPALPSVVINGVSSGAGSATQQLAQILLQADPSNTGANIYIGGRGMVKATRAGVGLVLPKTA